LQNSTSSKTWS